MNGTRGGPPGRTAENWSRSDGIRAGAVSGPWRSGPRGEGAAPAGSDPQPNGSTRPEPLPPPPLAWTGKVRASDAQAEVAPARAGRVRMVAWVGFGVLLALGIVAAAVVFRLNAPPAEPQAPEAAAPAEGPGDAVPDAARAAPVATAEVPAAQAGQVRLRISEELPAERRDAIVAALEAAGMGPVQVETLPFRIASSRVGYYRAADREAAAALASRVGPVIDPAGGEVALRDYGQLLNDAEPGRLDLWIGD